MMMLVLFPFCSGSDESHETGERSLDLSSLGVNDLSMYNYTLTVDVDPNTCEYTFQLAFRLPVDSFPMGEEGVTCLPGVDAPEDGVPYLNGRWYWESLPPHIQAATGIDHMSIDWNPCGHPGPGFLTPHTE